jgi:RimJ/RimL family protein N-acetyltransferase
MALRAARARGIERALAFPYTDNTPSQRVLEKCGFSRAAHLDDHPAVKAGTRRSYVGYELVL